MKARQEGSTGVASTVVHHASEYVQSLERAQVVLAQTFKLHDLS